MTAMPADDDLPRLRPARRQPPQRTAAGRVLSLLGAFSRGGGSLTLSEIARYADLSLTTAHRLAKEVLEWGGLELDDEGHYRLSQKFLDLASTSTAGLHLRETALPHLSDLHRLTGLTVQLAVKDGDDVLYLEALRPHSNYTGENRIGGRLKLHVTAIGLVLLAYAGDDVIEDYLSRPLKRYTPHTIADPDGIRAYCAAVRKNRVAVGQQSITMGAGAVAAPVFNDDGSVTTAVGMVFLLGRDDPQKLIDPVRATANRISHALAAKRVALAPQTIDFNRRHAGLILDDPDR